MQRLVLAVLILAVLAGLLALLVLGAQAALRAGDTADRSGVGSIDVRKLAFAALFILIVGVSVGALGGL